jgi:hypothetical protein
MPKKTAEVEGDLDLDDEELDPEEPDEEDEDSDEEELRAFPDTTSGQATTPPDGRLRDLLFKELKKRDEKIDGLAASINSGFGELRGMLAAGRPAETKGSGEDSGDEPELTNEQIQQYIEQGRGPEVFKYISRIEAKKIARDEARRERQSMMADQVRTTVASDVHREFPELKNAAHPFTLKANEIYYDLVQSHGGEAKVQGTSLQVELAARAAERAARLYGDLRDATTRKVRREAMETETSRTVDGSLPVGRGKPKQKAGTPALTKQDAQLASIWGVDLKDEKHRNAILGNKKFYEGLRYEKRAQPED